MYTAEQLHLNEVEYNYFMLNLDMFDTEEIDAIINDEPVYCICCNCKINPIRIHLCPETKVCTVCAKHGHGQPPPVKAIMIFDHKTGGELHYMSEGAFQETKRLTNRKGQTSILRKVSPSRD